MGSGLLPFLDDLRYALRTLRRAPVFATAALLSLTVGIGSSSIAFGLVDAAMLRRPPFAEADRLVVVNITQRTPLEGELRQRWSWRLPHRQWRGNPFFTGCFSSTGRP